MTFEPSEGFLLSLFGGLSALLVSLCACVLRSRCTRIKFGCIELDRDVLSPSEFPDVERIGPTIKSLKIATKADAASSSSIE